MFLLHWIFIQLLFPDIDECTAIATICGVGGTCTNTPAGSFTCECDDGYDGGGEATVCAGDFNYDLLGNYMLKIELKKLFEKRTFGLTQSFITVTYFQIYYVSSVICVTDINIEWL